jgi:hypothetical protein
LGQNGLAVAHIEAGQTQIRAVGPLPLHQAQRQDHHQRQGGAEDSLEDGTAQKDERREQDQNIVQHDQQEGHVADLEVREVDPGHDLDHPDQQVGEEGQDVTQEQAHGGQEERKDDLHETQDDNHRHERRGLGCPNTRQIRDVVYVVEQDAGAG